MRIVWYLTFSINSLEKMHKLLRIFFLDRIKDRIMNGPREQEKPLHWAVIAFGVLFGGYLILTLLGAVLGLAFSAAIIFGGMWLVHRFWNKWKLQKKEEPELTSVPPAQNLDQDLEQLKAKMKQKIDE